MKREITTENTEGTERAFEFGGALGSVALGVVVGEEGSDMGATREAIRGLEELSMNAWPGVGQVVMDGWVARFSEGFTRRANCVNPLYGGVAAVEEKVAGCEALYRRAGLPVVFKMTEAAEPVGLDPVLEKRGYVEEAPTSVQVRDLGEEGVEGDGVVGFDGVEERWLEALVGFSPALAGRQALLKRMLGAIVPERRLAMVVEGGRVVSVGMGVVERGYVGLFDIMTHPEERRRGYATRVMGHLMGWGKSRGAGKAYLQVMLENGTAVRMYERMGFREHHRYVYRIRSLSSSGGT